mmetsp:Transcript_32880/g.59550  ORF Transcript_32880/g.59550 Transcript_32880/m.59550 type:complete len:117 (+) Transcript_32880:102-452(+)
MKLTVILVGFVAALCGVDGFTVQTPRRMMVRCSSSYSSTLQMTVLTYGNKKKDFKAGSPLKSACAALGVKPRYSCKKGECNSCVLTVGGTRMKPCVDKVPPEPKLKSLQENGLAIR